jgi:hypothetical protein
VTCCAHKRLIFDEKVAGVLVDITRALNEILPIKEEEASQVEFVKYEDMIADGERVARELAAYTGR